LITLKKKHLKLAEGRVVDYSTDERELLKETFRSKINQFLKKTQDSRQRYIFTLTTERSGKQEGGFSLARSEMFNIDDALMDFDRLWASFEKLNQEYFTKGAFHLFNEKITGLNIEATY
jgi:hypothetical protein